MTEPEPYGPKGTAAFSFVAAMDEMHFGPLPSDERQVAGTCACGGMVFITAVSKKPRCGACGRLLPKEIK